MMPLIVVIIWVSVALVLAIVIGAVWTGDYEGRDLTGYIGATVWPILLACAAIASPVVLAVWIGAVIGKSVKAKYKQKKGTGR